MNKKDTKELTDIQLLEIADLFVKETHSEGWKKAEAKDLMSDDYTNFIEIPKDNWKENIIKYLTDRDFKIPNNRLFKN